MLGRYLVFIWGNYYPSGGWNDFSDSFDDLDEAVACMEGKVSADPFYNGQVIDSTTGREVASA
jgi:hypothetical protein